MSEKDLSFTVREELEGLRLDKGISEFYEEISRSRIQKVIKEKAVSVNGSVEKPSYILNTGDEISFMLPDNEVPDIVPEDIGIDVLYEDDDVIVVNKPKHMVVHPAAGHYTGTLVNALMYHCSDLSGINGVLRPGIVHRIDMDTTGSLIVCKTDKAHRLIAEQLAVHSIDRRYRAIVHGVIKDEEGTIDKPIGRDKRDRKKMAVDPMGKRAVTHYRVIERFREFSYIECRLETGRTHQIRVHMNSIGHPVLGDEVYGNRKSRFKTEGQTLHAFFIGFDSPSDGRRIEVTAPLPEYFTDLLKSLSVS
ncbi:MAG: RluA family pseudouridine synthase [Lachnospiraceae bacterium]|nr:RluA family pseudouridine synthase [Lachnospiraceae bacterium]